MNNFLDGKADKQQYEILERIGSGGFGEVYKANDKSNNRLVAIKVFQKQLGQNDNASVDWEREADHALTLKTEHVIESYEFVKPSDDPIGNYYLAMEFADNGSLRKLIDEQKAKKEFFSESTLVDIFKQALLGFQSVHRSTLHRDVKPENMLFVGDILKLSDFGLAKRIDQATRTRTYKGWGTYIYMAPESWSLAKMTPATDIYSLGIVFYELSTLQLPFSSADVIELENLHKYGDRPRVRSTNPQLSSKLDGIIYKMMSQSANSRYYSADEILQELDHSPTAAPLSSSLQNAVTLAQQLHTNKIQEEAAQQKHHDQEVERTKMSKVKIKEFIDLLEQSIESFNQAAPESKLFLSKGNDVNYTLIWDKTDLLRFSINPYIGTVKLKGQQIVAYVEVNFRVVARPNEGTCFVLCISENDSNDYGQWKVLENTYNPLIQSPGVYSLAAEYSQLKHLERQGNAMGQFQYTIRNTVTEELETTINKAFEYHNQSLASRRTKDKLVDKIEDDEFGFGN